MLSAARSPSFFEELRWSVDADTHRLRPCHEGFEDGTPDFLGIAALPAGFALLDEVGMGRLSAHVAETTALLLNGLRGMRHVEIYGPRDLRQRGGTVAFNVRGVPFPEVETRAAGAGISVRGGCFCNPGASEKAFGITDSGECLAQLGDAFTVEAFAACTGVAAGAVRASVGMATNAEDVRRLLAVVASFGR